MKNIKLKLILAFLFTGSIISCEITDINVNPDSPTASSVNAGSIYPGMISQSHRNLVALNGRIAGIVIQQYFSKDLFVSGDYREELSNGAVLAGVRHSQRVFDLRLNKKNFIKIKNRPVHLKIGYAEGVNLRGVKSIKFESEITDKIGLNFKYVDNMGKGPIGSNNQNQNRNYLVSEIAYKF